MPQKVIILPQNLEAAREKILKDHHLTPNFLNQHTVVPAVKEQITPNKNQ